MDATIVARETGLDAPPPVTFETRRWPLFWRVALNLVLMVLTLGIYRFWAKTAIRRMFWAGVRIAGEPLEYTGRGLELFIGFLIVLAVLVPLGILTGVAQATAGVAVPWLEPVLSVVNFLVVLFLVQLAVFRMTRYRLTRTRWRGIRFGLDGAPRRYAARGFLWLLSLAPSLGLTAPFMLVDLARYRVRRMRFGDTRFRFDGSGKALLWPWVIQGLPLVLGLVAAIVLQFTFVADQMHRFELGIDPGAAREFARNPGPMAAASLAFLTPVAWIVLHIWYRVRAFRYLVGCIGFGDARFESRLSVGRVLVLGLVTGVLYLLLFAIIGGALTTLAGWLPDSDAMGLNFQEDMVLMIVGIAAGFVALLVVSPFVSTVFWRVAITQAVCGTLTISDLAPFERVAQSAAEDPRHGEGLADAFDVDAF